MALIKYYDKKCHCKEEQADTTRHGIREAKRRSLSLRNYLWRDMKQLYGIS